MPAGSCPRRMCPPCWWPWAQAMGSNPDPSVTKQAAQVAFWAGSTAATHVCVWAPLHSDVAVQKAPVRPRVSVAALLGIPWGGRSLSLRVPACGCRGLLLTSLAQTSANPTGRGGWAAASGYECPVAFPELLPFRSSCQRHGDAPCMDTAASQCVLAPPLAATSPLEKPDRFPWEALRCSRVGERRLPPHPREEPCLIPVLSLLSSRSPGLPRGPAPEPDLEARRPPPRHLLQGEPPARATSLRHGTAGLAAGCALVLWGT